MKQLTVLRHAKSSWDDNNLDDFDRPLNARGLKAARRMGSELKSRGFEFDLALASPAARVRETLAGLAHEFGESAFPVRFESEVYLASGATLLTLVQAVADDVDRLLLVGHNPGLQQLIVELATAEDGKGLRRRVVDKYPTAALAVLNLPVDSWSEVAPGRGRLTDLILPADLD